MADHADSWLDKLAAAGDQVYSGFLVRDFLAKAIPGALVTGAAALSLPTYSRSGGAAPESGWAWLALYGLSVAAGFAVQAVGERVGLHRAHPKAENDEAYYQRLAAFKSMHLTPATVAQRERLVVVKELAGNLATAGLMAGGLLLARLYSLRLARITGLVLVVLVVISLIWLHRESGTRQKQYEEAAITRGST